MDDRFIYRQGDEVVVEIREQGTKSFVAARVDRIRHDGFTGQMAVTNNNGFSVETQWMVESREWNRGGGARIRVVRSTPWLSSQGSRFGRDI